ncbi:MAG: c-type cytochrome domain-containing protein [Isosphaeraceae bacterium]|nr:c-type cytochrome domain-containing protein [Isosphaeraceae bacterium]
MHTKLVLATLVGWVSLAAAAAADDSPDYGSDVRPLLRARCTVCHSEKNRSKVEISGGLVLDSIEGIRRGVGGKAVVKPGDPGKSSLITRLSETDEDLRMPRDADPLAEAERELLRRWVEAGLPAGGVGGTPSDESVEVGRSSRPARTGTVSISYDRPLEKNESKPVSGTIRLVAAPMPPVTALAFSPDGGRLAVGSHGRVVVWDLPKLEPAHFVDDFPGMVGSLLFPDGDRLVIGGGRPAIEGVVEIRRLSSGKLERRLTGHDDVVAAVALRPDGRALATASFDQTVRFWDLTDAATAPKVFRGHSDFVHDVVWMPDGRSVLSCSKDRSIKRIDVESLKETMTYSGHDSDVLSLALRTDGKEFVSGGIDSQLRIWSVDSEKSTKRLSGHSGPIHQLASSRSAGLTATASGDGSARLFRGDSWAPEATIPNLGEWQYAAALDADGKTLALGGWDGLTRVWKLDGKKQRLAATLVQPTLDPSKPDWLSVAADGRARASAVLIPTIRRVEGGTDVEPRLKGE